MAHHINVKFTPAGMSLSHPQAIPEPYKTLRLEDIPDAVTVGDAFRQLQKVIILPSAICRVPWSAIEGKAQGEIVRIGEWPIVNLYGEDGIAIHLDSSYDIVPLDEAHIRVIGHSLYACSLDEAHRSIRSAYLERLQIPDPTA